MYSLMFRFDVLPERREDFRSMCQLHAAGMPAGGAGDAGVSFPAGRGGPEPLLRVRELCRSRGVSGPQRWADPGAHLGSGRPDARRARPSRSAEVSSSTPEKRLDFLPRSSRGRIRIMRRDVLRSTLRIDTRQQFGAGQGRPTDLAGRFDMPPRGEDRPHQAPAAHPRAIDRELLRQLVHAPREDVP